MSQRSEGIHLLKTVLRVSLRVTEHLTVCSHNPTVRMHSKLSVKALTRDFDLVTAYQAVRWKMQCYLRQITTELTCL